MEGRAEMSDMEDLAKSFHATYGYIVIGSRSPLSAGEVIPLNADWHPDQHHMRAFSWAVIGKASESDEDLLRAHFGPFYEYKPFAHHYRISALD